MSFYDRRILPGGSPASWSLSCEVQGGRAAAATVSNNTRPLPGQRRDSKRPREAPLVAVCHLAVEGEKVNATLPLVIPPQQQEPSASGGREMINLETINYCPSDSHGSSLQCLLDAALLVTNDNLGSLKQFLPSFTSKAYGRVLDSCQWPTRPS